MYSQTRMDRMFFQNEHIFSSNFQITKKKKKDFESEIRGGTRGGKDQFKWDDVKNMKQNERGK